MNPDPDLYLQFLQATFKSDIQDYQREEDAALIAALRQLSPRMSGFFSMSWSAEVRSAETFLDG